jgi:hypothetical protein
MRAVAAALAFALLGFVPPKLKMAPRVAGTTVTITNSGQMFDLINTTDCIPWPNEEVKALGGQNGWGGWRPVNGDHGVAIARARHCFQDVNVVYVKIGAHYVPIGESGIQFTVGRLEDLPLLVLPKP